MSADHVEEVHHACSSLQVPHVDVPIVASGQHDPGVEGVRLQDEDLSLVALESKESVGEVSLGCCCCSTSVPTLQLKLLP